jgi:hypothetical protein
LRGDDMATTMFFRETIKDKKEGRSLEVEFGRSSFYGETLIYLNVWDVSLTRRRKGRSRGPRTTGVQPGYARDFDKDDFAGPAGD